MVKEDCKKQVQPLIYSHGNIVDITKEIEDGEWDPSKFMHHMEDSKKWLTEAKKEGLPKGQFDNAMSRFINPLEDMIEKKKGVDESDVEIDEVLESMVKFANSYYTWLLDRFSDCECGEMDHVSLKIPLDLSIHGMGTIEDALEKAGYEVGTDGYYEDPDNYYTVVVSATKKQELRRGGR